MPSTESMSARERAAKILVPGATMSGFTVKSAETIDELDAEAYVIDHIASGARLLFLACEDENKAFAIGFKTPPANDTASSTSSSTPCCADRPSSPSKNRSSTSLRVPCKRFLTP